MGINEISLLPGTIDAVAVFTGEKLDDFLLKIKEETEKFVPDISTYQGRKDIASVAYKVSQSKTALDALGKKLVEDWKSKAAKVDASRRKSREFLDNLRDEVRKPLTDWEVDEEARIKAEEEESKYSAAWDEAHALHELFLREQAIAAKEAEQARKEAEEKARQEKAEADRIAKEVAEAAEEARIVREEEIKKAAEARAKAEAAEAVAKVERERNAAEERAKLAAEQAVRERIAAEYKAKADQEAAVKKAQEEERAKIEKERIEKEAAEARAKAEADRLAANKKHREKINNEVISGLTESGIPKDTAELLISIVSSGKVKHLSIKY